MAHDHEKITYGMNEVKELFDASVLTGTIVSVDTDNDKAHVNISGFGQINDVPIFYHCPGSIVVEGGSVAFSEGDSVYVLNKEGKISPGASDLQIVGFVDGLRPCVWEPWTGPDFDTNHPWETRIDPWGNSPNAWMQLTANGLESYLEGGGPDVYNQVGWPEYGIPDPDMPEGLILKIKIKADVVGPSCFPYPALAPMIYLRLISNPYALIYLTFAACDGWPGAYFVGDNNGEEQTFNLADYGLMGEIIDLRLNMIIPAGWTGQIAWRHIHFVS